MQTPNSIVTVHSFGLNQSQVRERLGRLLDVDHHPCVTTSADDGVVTVHLGLGRHHAAVTESQIDQTTAQVERCLGPIVYGHGAETIQESLVAILSSNHLTMATAESCTGGLIGKIITDVPGASGVYLGGWIVYSNQVKSQQLGVPIQLIQENGAVSQAVARALADSAIRRSEADVSVAVTGIAGPDGGTADKPVGTVWIGLGTKRRHVLDDVVTETWMCQLPGDRKQIRSMAAKCAIGLLRLSVLGASMESVSVATRVE